MESGRSIENHSIPAQDWTIWNGERLASAVIPSAFGFLRQVIERPCSKIVTDSPPNLEIDNLAISFFKIDFQVISTKW